MTFVVTEPCIGNKNTACMDICPVGCIHPMPDDDNEKESFEKEPMVYIDPDQCIDCGACEPACPVTAIFPEHQVPEKWKKYIAINANYHFR